MPSIVSNSRQRFLSLWLPRLPTDRIRRQWREAEKTGPRAAQASRIAPLIVVGKRRNVERLVAVDAAAEEQGLRVGLTLAEARAMVPAIHAVEEDAGADARLLEAIADWCGRYTPLLAVDGKDAVLLDIAGCAHLFGGEAALCEDLIARLFGFGFAARASIADTIGAAWAAARFSPLTHVEPGRERECLAPLPIAALRLPDDMVAVLARVGLKRIDDIIDLPRSPLAARFGSELLRQLDRALGREREPLTPLLPLPPYFTEQRFAEPIAREDDVLATILKLAQRLRDMLERRGEGARLIELTLFRTDGAVRRVRVGTSRPTYDPQGIRALFSERLTALADEWDPGFGFDLARLAILKTEPVAPSQIGLESSGPDPAALDELTDRLVARLGRHRVTRLVAQDSHIPEIAGVALPAQSFAARNENGWDAFRRFRGAVALAPRPLRLLTRPEPITVTPMEVDAPPIKFQWRRAWHDVVSAAGPERIEAAWWTDEGGRTRDYFQVEDSAGRRFWLFRAGLYRDQYRGDERPLLWFMHGLFA